MKYIFLTNFIVEIGGAQQFLRNKVVELQKRGFDVFLFHAKNAPVYINDLKVFKKNFYPELRYSPICFNRREIERVIESIIAECNGIEPDSIIDTSCIPNLEWGELIAKKCKCKCVGFLVDEAFSPTRDEIEFLTFKHKRKEIAGTSKQSLHLLFHDFHHVKEDECYSFYPCCSNTVDNVDNPFEQVTTNRDGCISIGCLGRLDKPYIINSLNTIALYIKEHQEKKFNVIVIGSGTSSQHEKKIQNIFKSVSNANLVITGFLYPIPRNLLKGLDVCISSAASAKVSANEGVPTVYVNALTGKPVGIMNYTLPINDDQLSRYSENYINMNQTLDDILFNDYCKKNNPLSPTCITDYSSLIKEEINNQLDFISSSIQEKKYYDITLIHPQGLKLHLFSIIGKIFGGHFLYYIHIHFYTKIKGFCFLAH